MMKCLNVRLKIREVDKSTLVIDDIPYNTTTTSLIDSIIKANDKGKIKIRKVIDNTADKVEILVNLHKNQSPSITIDALYAFTDCEVSISPNACVIVDEKPQFLGVKEILKYSADSTKNLLQKELEIKRDELKEKILFSTLEKIFIENKIYQQIEKCETWNDVIDGDLSVTITGNVQLSQLGSYTVTYKSTDLNPASIKHSLISGNDHNLQLYSKAFLIDEPSFTNLPIWYTSLAAKA